MAFLSRGSLVPLSNSTPSPVGVAGSAGSSLLAARADHVHAAGALTGSSGVVWTSGTLWSDVYAEASAQVPNRIIVPNDNTDRHITPGSYDLSQITFVAEARVTSSGGRAPITVDNNAILAGGLHLEGVHVKFACTSTPAITASVFLDITLRDAQISNLAGATLEPIFCPSGVTSQQIRLYDGSKIGDSAATGTGIVKLANDAAASLVAIGWGWIDDLTFVTPGAATLTYEYDSSTATSGTPIGAGITVTEAQLDGADLVSYTPNTPDNWVSSPSRVSDALDGLAAVVGTGLAGSGPFVHLTGTETITGAKTFSAGAVISSGQKLSSDGDLNLAGGSGKRIIFLSDTTERMRMSSQGSLSLGTTTEIAAPGNILLSNGGSVSFLNSLSTAVAGLSSSSDDTVVSALRMNGTLYAQGDTFTVRDTSVNTYLTVSRSTGAVSTTVSAGTNTVLDQLTLARQSTGTAAAGIGVGLLGRVQNSIGTLVDATRVSSILSTATSGAEIAQLSFSTRSSGSVTDRLVVRQGVMVYDGLFVPGTADPGAGTLLIGNNKTFYARRADNNANIPLLKLDSTNTLTLGDSGSSIGPFMLSSTDARFMSGATIRALLGSNLLVVGAGANDGSTAPGAPTIRAPQTASSLNAAGVGLTLATGLGRGSAAQTFLTFQSNVVGSSGSTIQTYATRMTIGAGVTVGASGTDPGANQLRVEGNTLVTTTTAASSGSQVIAAPTLTLRGAYWTGAASANHDMVMAYTPNAPAGLGEAQLSMTQGGFQVAKLWTTTGGVTSGFTVGRQVTQALAIGSAHGFGNYFEGGPTYAFTVQTNIALIGSGAGTLVAKFWDTANVRIGTTNADPGYKLQVDGTTNTTSYAVVSRLMVADGLYTPSAADPGAGNVLIGNTKAIYFRRADNGANITGVTLDNGNSLIVGDTALTYSGFRANTALFVQNGTTNVHALYTNSSTYVLGTNALDTGTTSPATSTIRTPNLASSTDTSPASFVIGTGFGRGAGAQATISFQTNVPTTSGTGAQTVSERMRIGAGMMIGTTTDPGAGKLAVSTGLIDPVCMGIACALVGNAGASGVAGNNVALVSGAGWASTGAANGTAGGDAYIVCQDGGSGSGTFTPGAGGSVNLQSGKGGAGTASVAPANGGGINITANSAGNPGTFGGGANGGTVSIEAGLGTGTGINGAITIGTARARSITLGRTGIVTTVLGGLGVGTGTSPGDNNVCIVGKLGWGTSAPVGVGFDASTVGQRWATAKHSGSTTITATDRIKIFDVTGGNMDATLPNPATVAAGFVVTIIVRSTSSTNARVQVVRNGSEKINDVAANLTMVPGMRADFVTDGTDWWTLNETNWYRAVTNVTDTDYSVTGSDYRISYTTLTSTRTVTGQGSLGAQHKGREIIVEDVSGAASGTVKIVFVPGTGTIDGAGSKDIIVTARGSWRGWFDGADWHTTT